MRLPTVSRAALGLLFLVALVGAAYLLGIGLPAAYVDGEFIPVSQDSFYHARRILDATGHLDRYYQFDPNMHAPQGSYVVWPWAYDWCLAALLSLLMLFFPGAAPMSLLAFVPVLGLVGNLALLALLCRELRLSAAAAFLVLGGTLLSPPFVAAHSIGVVDHHFLELSSVLLALLTGMRWLRDPGSLSRAAAAGLTLAVAHGVHNGLFLLQLPLLLTATLLWWRGWLLPARAVAAFGLVLLAALTLLLLPSEPFRNAARSFYFLSWFHLYAAAATALYLALLARWDRTPRSIAGLTLVIVLVVAAALPDLALGLRFVSADIAYLRNVAEASSLAGLIRDYGFGVVLGGFSPLPLLLPVLLPLLIWRLWRAEAALVLLLVWVVFGSVLMLGQIRLWYYGLPLLLLALALLFDHGWNRLPRPARGLPTLVVVLAMAALFALAWTELSRTPWAARDHYYVRSRLAMQPLAEACRVAPGIVLAEKDYGHFIRFHTDCPVISNNFILTEQQIERIVASEKLLQLAPAELRTRGAVKYVLLVQSTGALQDFQRGIPVEAKYESRSLVRALLMEPGALPEGYKLLWEQRWRRAADAEIPIARIVEILPATPTDAE